MAAQNASNVKNWVIENLVDSIQLGMQLCRGANSTILEAKWKGTEVIVKEILTIDLLSKPDLLEQSSRLRHPNIVRFFGIYLPPGARVPSLVMERLHCSLTNLLEQTPVIPIETKLSILHDVSLGVRYLHSHSPPIIHCELYSNNVLLTKGMEGKISDLGTARLIYPRRQAQMIKVLGTVGFMPPEVVAYESKRFSGKSEFEKELDVFSFGCVMLHTLSHQWPTPSEPVVTDPVTFEMKARSEVERRSSYFDRIDRNRLGVLIPLIESCLSNLPKNRTSIVTICEQLEGLVDRKHVPTVVSLQQELQAKDIDIDNYAQLLQRKEFEIHIKDGEIKALRSDISRLQTAHFNVQPKQVTTNFWKNLKLTWQKCADLPGKLWITSVTELDGKVYVAASSSIGGSPTPFMYNTHKNHWSTLPQLPCWYFSLVSMHDRKELLAIGGVASTNNVVMVTNKVFLWDEENEVWLTPYADMPTARCESSCISRGSSVIVAGGIASWDPLTVTRSVEVLHITDTDSHWSVVEQLPFATYEAVPLIVNDNLYIAAGFTNKCYGSTCNVVTASLPQLLQSSNTSSGQVWNKLPGMPYCSYSINHYQGCLITFTGDHQVEQPSEGKPVRKSLSLIHIYDPIAEFWDCVGEIPYRYHFGHSVHLDEYTILFLGGVTAHSKYETYNDDDMVTDCMMLTLKPHLTLIDHHY